MNPVSSPSAPLAKDRRVDRFPTPSTRSPLISHRTGYHARRREEREQRAAARDGKLGLHGIKATQPLPDQDDLKEQIKVPDEAEDSTGGTYEEIGYRPPLHITQDEIPGPKPASGTVPTIQPITPPNGVRRKMVPHLMMMTGVMLRCALCSLS